MATSTTSSVNMVTAFFTSSGQFLSDSFPLIYLFLGIAVTFFFLKIFTGAFTKGLKSLK